MEYEVTCEEIEVVPPSNTLSNDEIYRRCIAKENVKSVTLGDKRCFKTDDPEEVKELDMFYEELFYFLTIPRLIHNDHMVAVWDFEKKAARVVRQKGKMDKFGYTYNKALYLENYEALFLLETDRLKMDYYNLPITLEQAYLLFIGEEASLQYAEYMVYTTLTRKGIVVQKYKNCSYDCEAVTKTDCIWAILKNELYDLPIPDRISASKYFTEMKSGMIKNQNLIRESQSGFNDDELPESSNTKRINFAQRIYCNTDYKTESVWQPNRQPPVLKSSGHLEEIKKLLDRKKFKDVFEKLEIIKLKTNIKNPDTCRKFNISFDLYEPKGFRKSNPGVPVCRLIIFHSDDKFPTHDEMLMCYCQQIHPTNLIFVSVSESNQIHGFHCTFT
ncbi:uncharacterized protein LOC119676429 [Teleopsis dalmanni]|uniref:uncharacterized protein LOC119676429 n=1 Tax=Teleopsis dalmanni TaxID=139649 RepID=UPI0018CE7D6D|nr:uncharacterized protein LOC119676429 [Teleopsis dalmanni]